MENTTKAILSDFQSQFRVAQADKHDIEYAQDEVISSFKTNYPGLSHEIDLEVNKILAFYREL